MVHHLSSLELERVKDSKSPLEEKGEIKCSGKSGGLTTSVTMQRMTTKHSFEKLTILIYPIQSKNGWAAIPFSYIREVCR